LRETNKPCGKDKKEKSAEPCLTILSVLA